MEAKLDEMPASHPLMETQIQRFRLGQNEASLKYDTMEIIIKSPDSGLAILMFLNPANSEWVNSESMTVGCTAEEM